MRPHLPVTCAIIVRLSPLGATSVGVVGALLISFAASAQTLCQVSEIQKIESPSTPPNPDFARAVDIAADTIVIGDPSDGELGEKAGAVHVMTFDGKQYVPTQILRADDGDAGDRFGASVAINGQTMVVGTPRDELPGEPKGAILNAGSAYVFVQTAEGLWTQAAKLVAPDAAHPAEFGHAVAIWANVILVGAWNDPQVGLLGGAVYVYEVDGSWPLKQKVTAADGDGADQFGGAVAIDGTFLVVGAHGHGPGLSFGAGAAYVFQNDGKTWSQIQKLEPGPNAATQSFGRAVDVSGDVIVVGSPQDVAAGRDIATGVAYVYQNDGTSWGLMQELSPNDGMAGDEFGTSLATHNGILAVGSPKADVEYPLIDVDPAIDAGVAYVFEHDGVQWSNDHKIHADYVDDGDPNLSPGNRMGTAVAMNSGRVVLGSPLRPTDESPEAAAYVFPAVPSDCDGNGLPDVCDPDCNRTRVPDACEILGFTSDDCNGNSIPDECEAPHGYIDDEGRGEIVWGSVEGFGDFDVVWLKTFTVTPGHQRITHIAYPWTPWIEDGTPITLLVYDDPNDDGDPHDAVLRSSVTIAATNDFGRGSKAFWSIHPIEPLVIGAAGERFFVGGYAQCTGTTIVVTTDSPPLAQLQGESWGIYAELGQMNLEDLSVNSIVDEPFAGRNVMMRALTLDCNANNIWDQCDIDSGLSIDANGNGIPDECGNGCLADVDGSDFVNVDDLLLVIESWGQPGPIGDATGDGLVDVNDIIAVINHWGMCP